MRSNYIWMDGEMVPFEKATVHFLNPTMHYGMGMFEGIRCYNTSRGPAVFRLKEHVRRLIESVLVSGIRDFPYTFDQIYQAVHLTITANGFQECYIRPLVYLNGPLGINLDDWSPSLGIAAWEWAPLLGREAQDLGVRLMVSSFTRLHPNVMMTKAKVSGNYVNSTLAKTVAKRSGFDETVLLDPQGYVSECSGENLFLVRDGVIYTPPRTTILEGITRDSVITLARDLGYQVVEELIARDQLYIADEIFLCGTAAEITPVREIDFRVIGSGRKGPVTAAIQDAFYRTVCGGGERSTEWLDMVDESIYAV